MTRRDKDFMGLEVVSLEDATVVGTVDALLVDDHATVVGLVLDMGVYEAKVLAFSDVKSVGDDAIMIASADPVKLISEVPALEDVADLEIYVTDALAMTDQGDLVGVVGDYFVDTASGAINGIEVLPEDAEDDSDEALLVPASQVIRIGAELVMLKAGFEKSAVPDPDTL